MTQAEKLHFVKEMCDNVRDELLAKLSKTPTPEAWDGIELRMLIRDRFFDVVIHGTTSRGRVREFNNFCMVNNL